MTSLRLMQFTHFPRNKTRILFLPQTLNQLHTCLDSSHGQNLTLMNEILLKLFLFFSTNSLPIAKDLQPGLSKDTITDQLKKTIGIAPNDLIELFSWKDGIKFEGKPSRFFDYCYLYNLQEAIDDYGRFQALTPEQSVGINYEFLFPICLTGAGEYYFYCFDGKNKGKIYYESVGRFGAEVVLAFDSLSQMMSSIYECYQSKIYYYDENKRWQAKFLEQERLMKKLNPHCKRWEEDF